MNEDLSAGELAQISAGVLEGIPFPALVLEVPSERIVAASPAATRLLDPDGGVVVGHLFEDFTADHPDLGTNIFAGGRLNGFETFRVLHRSAGADANVRMWIRLLDEQPASKFVVAIIVADRPPPVTTVVNPWIQIPAVVGTADGQLVIDRISSDAKHLFGLPVSALLGTPLAGLVSREDVPKCLAALNRASATGSGVTLQVRIRTGVERLAVRCEQLILPLEPLPSCVFVFLPLPDGKPSEALSIELSHLLLQLGRGAEIANAGHSLFRGMTEQTMPGLSRLTTREFEIVARLLDGDRPPAIAKRLFLSQSTIRTHLASAFAKLGVESQQQLLGLFRQQ